MSGCFFDTNVLLYLASADNVKANRAEALLSQGGTISVQVLNEVANVGRRKIRMSWLDLHMFLVTLRQFLVVEPISIETHERGLVLAERYGFSTYDAMIVASAGMVGCKTLLSEDMQDGLCVDGDLLIINPFKAGYVTA